MLPDNFAEIHRAWRQKKITLAEAAQRCNMPLGTFYDRAVKLEKKDKPILEKCTFSSYYYDLLIHR